MDMRPCGLCNRDPNCTQCWGSGWYDADKYKTPGQQSANTGCAVVLAVLFIVPALAAASVFLVG